MAYMYYGKQYNTKAEMRAAQKEGVSDKNLKKNGSIFEGRLAKNKRAAANAAKANTGATKKMYAAESMFKANAKNKIKEDALNKKPKMPKAQNFRTMYEEAGAAGKDNFLVNGKKFLTEKGRSARDKEDAATRISSAPKKEGFFGKLKSSKTGAEFFQKLKKK